MLNSDVFRLLVLKLPLQIKFLFVRQWKLLFASSKSLIERCYFYLKEVYYL